jgi:hypothetical protein
MRWKMFWEVLGVLGMFWHRVNGPNVLGKFWVVMVRFEKQI